MHRLVLKQWNNWLLLVLLLLLFLYRVDAGCHKLRFCCTGHNITCMALDNASADGRSRTSNSFNDLSSSGPKASRRRYAAVFDVRNKRIGTFVAPDLIRLDRRAARVLAKHGRSVPLSDPSSRPGVTKSAVRAIVTRAPAAKTLGASYPSTAVVRELIFGETTDSDNHAPDIRPHYRTYKLIRYSVLNRHVPLTVKEVRRSYSTGKWSSKKLAYLEVATPGGRLCYCDEACLRFGDCCSDYMFVCPPQDCRTTEWQQWSGCVPDHGLCGLGVRTRLRFVQQTAEHGGADCPALVEKTTCFEPCQKSHFDEVVTVALLLDYKYNRSRDSPSQYKTGWPSYCVNYKIGWVNKNCLDRVIKNKLFTGGIICAECQPQARMHRPTMRCASELNDGQTGFWKLIGPKSCNGIWKRLSRVDNCHCANNHPRNQSFLLV